MPSHQASLIKGCLPVRLKLPSLVRADQNEETFFYVREHRTAQDDPTKSKKDATGSTLFVANAPVVPGITTKMLLKSLLGRYADISRVTVVENPRQSSQKAADAATPQHTGTMSSHYQSSSSSYWTLKAKDPTFLAPVFSEGKFAHVVFRTPKDMRRTMRGLQDIMQSSNDDDADNDLPGLTLEKIEIQTLSDATKRQYAKETNRSVANDEQHDFDVIEEDDLEHDDEPQGILAIAAQYRASCNTLDRSMLMEECNAVMQAYEDAEEEKKRVQEAAKANPDDDGFITVSYSSAVGSKVDLEQNTTGPNRRKGAMRSRKKKEVSGTDELTDFYRFQRKDNRKRTLDDLRKQFDEDLQKVKKMKGDRQYRPF
jgi:ribosomal RNA-processing protein 7